MRATMLQGALVAVMVGGCARNPATGRLEFSLIDPTEELAIGREADAALRETERVYEDSEALSAYVERVGQRVAASTERPDLPWRFRILDDGAVNAFALPGGFVYVTRGMLGHLNSEDELAAVLGHECAHVVARHGAATLQRAAAAERRLELLRRVDPELRHVGAVAARNAVVRQLRYSHAQENLADALSVRYLERTGYAPAALAEVFGVLARLEASTPDDTPVWLSSHPEPRDRRTKVAALTGAVERDEVGVPYMESIDGLVFGDDPRDGYFVGDRFVHPRSGFELRLPARFIARHRSDTVVATSPSGDTLLVVGPSRAASIRAGLAAFFRPGVVRGVSWRGRVGGHRAETAHFEASTEDGVLRGLVGFIEYRTHVIAVLAFTAGEFEPKPIEASIRTFRRARQRDVQVEPMRIEIVELPAEATLADLYERAPSSVPLDVVARINHVRPDESLPAGRLVKRVIGFNPEFAAGRRRRPAGGETN